MVERSRMAIAGRQAGHGFRDRSNGEEIEWTGEKGCKECGGEVRLANGG